MSEFGSNKESGGGGDGGCGGVGNGKSGEGFIDRSKVRILLCDNDAKSLKEVFTLLCKCSYQVTAVRSPRQVIDALNAEGPDIDIILSEIDLPMAKGFKMLKYMMRDKDLRRIPVIMMSAQDEVSLVVKCLKFGAADYLVKPLRTNELLNLWIHMWRRRRMLGLAEKNILNYELDLVSDPSDANTNSTTLFSDDTDDKSRKSANPELCVSTHQEYEPIAASAPGPLETPPPDPMQCRPDVPGISDRWTGQISSCPKKSELKIGESSAFFTYVKSNTNSNTNTPRINTQDMEPVHEIPRQRSRIEKEPVSRDEKVGCTLNRQTNQELEQTHSQQEQFSIPYSHSLEISKTEEHFSQTNRNDSRQDVLAFQPNTAYPYYIPGGMNQVMMPHYNHHVSQCQHMQSMPFQYYPYGICVQPGQMAGTNPWPPYGNVSPNEGEKPSKVNRREAALIKFRQKRKERCFDKKIRYVNRKHLAERRPRVRGQFVRKVNGIGVDLNGQPSFGDEDDEEDDEVEDEEEEDDASLSQQ